MRCHSSKKIRIEMAHWAEQVIQPLEATIYRADIQNLTEIINLMALCAS